MKRGLLANTAVVIALGGVTVLPLGLTACGGGGGSGVVQPPPPVPPASPTVPPTEPPAVPPTTVVPPTVPPAVPTTPPAPPPPPPAASRAGGSVSPEGSFSGAFDGVRATLRVSGGGAVGLGISYSNRVTFTPRDGSAVPSAITVQFDDNGTITLTADIPAEPDDPDAADVLQYIGETPWGGIDFHGFQEIDPRYGALILTALSDASVNGYRYFMYGTVGADDIVLPSTGMATFESATEGYYSGSGGYFYGTGDIVIDFQSGAVTGGFPDVDWYSDDGLAASMDGSDFGLALEDVMISSGDEFTGSIRTTATGDGANPGLTGRVSGDFYGPTKAEPVEIGGVYHLGGSRDLIVGGFLGVKPAP